MGLFSFGKKVKLYAPVDGTVTDLAETPGFAVTPSRHHVYSPVTGTISALAPEDHVIELTSGKATVRVQCGHPTIGQAVPYVHEGDAVTPETPIAFMDADDLAAAGQAATVTVTVDNSKSLKLSTSGQVSHDQEVATAIAK